MKKILPFLLTSTIFLGTHSQVDGQGLAAFTDYRNHFYIFDKGKFVQAEDYKVQSFQVGGQCVAYVNNASDFKVYWNGNFQTLERNPNIKYEATDYLLVYSVMDVLKVFEQGKVKTLSNAAQRYIIQDSLVAWYDRVQKRIEIYYQGKTTTLEDGLIQWPVGNGKAGDNILAWITSYDKKFKVFYQGRTYELINFVDRVRYEVDRDILAYIDPVTSYFRVFWKGQEFELETFPPVSFQMGYGKVAYIDNVGTFKLFKDGEVITVESFAPDNYLLVDNILVYDEAGRFKYFCNDQVETMEFYIPKKYLLDLNSIAYLSVEVKIKAIQDCKSFYVTHEQVNDINLIRDVIIFNEGVNTTKLWYNGQVYQHK